MESTRERFIAVKQRLFDRVYSKRLNPEQCSAVYHARGPLLVLAGAGSGKTTVLVNRISYLIKYGNAYYDTALPEGVDDGMVSALEELASSGSDEEIAAILPEFISSPCPPWALLAFTFTNKAAKEIRDRLEKTFEDKSVAESIWSGTFHSVCIRILHKYGELLGYRAGFSIYDTDDQKRLILLCMKDLEIDEKTLNPKAVAHAISMAKDRLVTPAGYEAECTADPRARQIARIYAYYQKKLMDYNAMDFDDIIVKTVELLEGHEEVRDYYQNKFRYVLVDEYQDTNYAQFVLTRLLSDKYRNIMVVGDDDQSIYRFRGATVENILNFDSTYPDAKVVKLEQNYRSTETILGAANAVIKNNSTRHDKSLWSKKGQGERIVCYCAPDQNAEGRYVIDRIGAMRRESGRRFSDFAILYRVNEMARTLESTFAKSGIPYRILGGQRFYDRKEIRDMLAYLHVIASPDDDMRLKRIINEPKRKIGASTVEAVEALAAEEGCSMYDVLGRAGEYTALSKSAATLRAFVSLMDTVRAEGHTPAELITALFDRTGYRAMLEAEGFEGEGRIKSVEEFVSAAAEYETRAQQSGEEITLQGFLEEVALVADVDKYDESADAVVMMTVHSAKGLEFPVVFLAGMEDGIFPSQMNLDSEEDMSEERRLCYVAITRAKERLFITHAAERMMYGHTANNPLSLFIREEVPKDLLLIEAEKRRTPPPRPASGYTPYQKSGPRISSDLARPPRLSSTPAPAKKADPSDFGVIRFAVGARVKHQAFGTGTVLSVRDMGGDILYEVQFDTVGKKKLMATYARLSPA